MKSFIKDKIKVIKDLARECVQVFFLSQIVLRAWAAAVIFSSSVHGQIDLDGNGLSDIWETVHEVSGLNPGDDIDRDGQTNFQESLVGSDPTDGGSYFGLDAYEFRWEHGDLELRISVVEESEYVIETSESLAPGEEEWHPAKRFTTNGSGPLRLWCPIDPYSPRKMYYRVRQVIDADLDGLTNWEEAKLGLDDHDAASSGIVGGGDLSWAVDQLLSGFELPLSNGMVMVGVPRSGNEISRFLNQATFGPTADEIDEIEASSQTFGEWIDEQMEMPVTTIKDSMAAEVALGAPDREFLFRMGWWRAAASGPDQLRQRVAFALSEILVVSGQGSDFLRGSSVAAGTYYDLLLSEAFGNYGDLLEKVTFNVGMGMYLGHFRNQKAFPDRGIFPDENYAREVMQLFSIGLWELNRDGSQKLDTTGQPIPTYTNYHITELAKVMTGFNWGGADSFLHYVINPELPMTMWVDRHDMGEKFLVNGGYLPAGLRPEDDVKLAIKNLVEHPSAGPFIGRQLIQRLVTSNPSPAYIERVSNAYYDNGAGEIGDLKSVVRAILLDPEARTENARGNIEFGKMREPYITYVHLVRAFGAKNEIGSYPILTYSGLNELGQIPLMSPTVFNFFSPEYSPSGELDGREIVAPEFEILTPLRSVGWPNYLRIAIEAGVGYGEVPTESILHHNFEVELGLLETPELLIERLDRIFTYGTLTEQGKQVIRDAIGDEWGLTDEKKVFAAIYLVMTSPQYAILR